MLVVHHLENSRSQRVLWLLEELGLEYEIRRYERDHASSLAPPELKSIHPLGKSPVITDGERVVAETGAIIEYILAGYGEGRLLPAEGTDERLRYTYWLHAGEGSVMPLVVMALIFGRVETAVPWFIRPIAKAIVSQVRSAYLGPNTKNQLDHMEAELRRSTWFAGDELSGADIMMSFPVEAAAVRVGLADTYPQLQAFLDRVHERPAYKRALEKGGPYELMS